MHHVIRFVGAGCLTLGLAGCGLEALLVDAGSEDHPLPVTTVRGTVANLPDSFSLTRADGQLIEPVAFEATGGAFQVHLPYAGYTNALLTAQGAERALMAYVSTIDIEDGAAGVTIDPRSTTAALIVGTALEASGTSLQVVEPCVLDAAIGDIYERMGTEDAETLLLAEVSAVGGVPDEPSQALLDQAALGVSFEGVIHPVLIRTVLEVDFSEGKVDGNCDGISRFRWVRDEPGKQMYFVGGLHEDSPVQDLEYNELMGSGSGSWTPNQVPMYDDGTNGDEVAGDNIWTYTLDLPRGARIGYKYTWGQRGQLWTGTEEWPGNQRILEIEDINGDNFVRRRDNFADEASNKDKSNLNRSGMGEIDWESDVNEDGIPDARERPFDLDNNCMLDEWVTPTAIGPATVACDE